MNSSLTINKTFQFVNDNNQNIVINVTVAQTSTTNVKMITFTNKSTNQSSVLMFDFDLIDYLNNYTDKQKYTDHQLKIVSLTITKINNIIINIQTKGPTSDMTMVVQMPNQTFEYLVQFICKIKNLIETA